MVPRLAGRCRKQLLKPLPPARLENFQRWAGPILKDRACQSGAEDMIMTDWASLLGRKVTVTRSARPSCDSGKSPPFSVSHYLTRSPSPCLSLSDCSRQKTKAMPTCQLQVDWEFASVPSQGPAAGPISPQKRITYDPSMWSESESPSVFIICARKRSIYPKFGYITSPVASKMVNLDIWTTVMISRGVYVTFQWLYNIGLVMN